MTSKRYQLVIKLTNRARKHSWKESKTGLKSVNPKLFIHNIKAQLKLSDLGRSLACNACLYNSLLKLVILQRYIHYSTSFFCFSDFQIF